VKVVLGSDHGGYRLKEQIKKWLVEWGYEVSDYGCFSEQSVDYTDFAAEVARAVAREDFARGILVCGTGIGMCIAANKVPGIRAALCHDVFSAKATRLHNNSNVLTMGQRVIGEGLAREIVKAWLEGYYEGGRHEPRLLKIKQLEDEYITRC